MKIPILFTAALALLLAAAPVSRTHAQGQDATFSLFYNNLADDGDWYNTPEYGYVWQPYIAYKSDSWRPYSDGYWAQTDDGWTWVSYEDFGWATYHYGRWTRLQDLGWAWVPGYEWGPGWVSWRTNDDYVGWAPLPPKRERGVYDGTIVGGPASVSVDYSDVEDDQDGYTPAVDDQYDIGPENYTFVECRHFGAPVLSVVVLPFAQNFEYFQGTVNVTNIYYQHQDNRVVVFNRGPDFAYLSRYSEQPIQQLRLERHDNASYLQGDRRGGFNMVQNGVLQVASPQIARGPVNFAQVKPPRVKATLPQAQVIHGWTGVNANPQAVQEMRQKVKQQAQAVPKRQANGEIAIPSRPTLATAPKGPRASAPAPAMAVAPAVGAPQPANPAVKAPLTDAEKLARRQQKEQERAARAAAGGQPAAPTEPAGAPKPAAQDTEAERAARKAAREQERATQPAAPAPEKGAPDTEAERAARKAAREQERATQPAAPAPEKGAPDTEAERAARKAAREQERATQPAAPAPEKAAPDADAERAARKAAREQERATQPAAPAPEKAAPDAEAERAARKAAREQERATQPAAPAAEKAAPDAEAERAARKAAREQERAAQPSSTPDDGKKKQQN